MSEENELTQVADDLVVTMDYTLTVEDKIIDSSKKNGPLRFVQGGGEIIPGLERQLKGLTLVMFPEMNSPKTFRWNWVCN